MAVLWFRLGVNDLVGRHRRYPGQAHQDGEVGTLVLRGEN